MKFDLAEIEQLLEDLSSKDCDVAQEADETLEYYCLDLAMEWCRIVVALKDWQYLLQSNLGWGVYKGSPDEERRVRATIDAIEEVLGGNSASA